MLLKCREWIGGQIYGLPVTVVQPDQNCLVYPEENMLAHNTALVEGKGGMNGRKACVALYWQTPPYN